MARGISFTISVAASVNEKSDGQPIPLLQELNVVRSASIATNGITFLNFLLFMINFFLDMFGKIGVCFSFLTALFMIIL